MTDNKGEVIMGNIPARRLVLTSVALAALAAAPVFAADAPAKPESLIIRAWPGPWGEAMKGVGKAFTDQTGIPVQIDNRPDEAVAKLVQVAHAQHRDPPVDVVYTMDTNSYKAAAQGTTETLSIEDVPNLAHMTAAAKPESGKWDYVKVAADVETLIYRASAFPNGAPDSYVTLFDPKVTGRVYANGSSVPAIATAALMNHWSVPQDMDKIWTFIETKMKPQRPILGFDQALISGFQRNEVDIGMSFPSNAAELHDADIKLAVAKEGIYAADEAFFVPAGLPEGRAYWTKQFVNFFLSKAMLTQYCGALTLPCFAEGLPVPAGASADPSFPKTAADYDKLFRLPVKTVAEQSAGWDAKFSAMMN